MNKSYKAATSVGTVALVLSGSLMAAAPPAFDTWTVSNGTITPATCATGFTCGVALSDRGFYQRQITETAGGAVYFQTIITENDATATTPAGLNALIFADESYVRTGNVNGLSDKQRISEVRFNSGTTGPTTTFRASTTLNAGWAGNTLNLSQSLRDSGDTFQTDFLFRQEGDSSVANGVTGKGMKITAFVPIAVAAVGGAVTDKQDFVLVSMQGDFTRGGPANITIPGQTPLTWVKDTVKGNGGMIGNEIKAVYVGQNLSQIVGQSFGFESYDNLTSPANDFISTFSLTAVAPTQWTAAAVFGDLVTSGTITDPFTPWP